MAVQTPCLAQRDHRVYTEFQGRKLWGCHEAGIQLNRVIQAETLSLLLASVEQGDTAAFLPKVAVANLPSDRFAVIQFKNLDKLSRETVLAWLPEVAAQKPVVQQAIRVLSISLSRTMPASN